MPVITSGKVVFALEVVVVTMSGDDDDVRPEGVDRVSKCRGDVSMRNSIGMLAGIVSRSMQRSSSKRRALSVPKLTCTMLMTGLRLLRLGAGAGTSRFR